MGKYEVNNSDTDNYGIYDYFKLKGYHKSLGIILDDQYVFKVDINDHYVSHVSFKDEYGPYNIYVCADSNYLGIQYLYEVGTEITDFQYRCILGILKECKSYIDETNQKIRIDVSDIIFNDKTLADDEHTIDEIIDDIETKYNMMFGKKK